jgi:hypothetical protein
VTHRKVITLLDIGTDYGLFDSASVCLRTGGAINY